LHEAAEVWLRVEEESGKNQPSSSTKLKLPSELPTVENVMMRLSARANTEAKISSHRKIARRRKGHCGFVCSR